MTLTITVPGVAAPKGSLRHVGNGRLIEQLKTSAPWRQAVILAAAQERDRCAWECLTGPVTVTIQCVFQRPRTVRREHPTTRSSGDADKLARNILDALVDAHIIGDDSQVCDLRVTKNYGVDALCTITVATTGGG